MPGQDRKLSGQPIADLPGHRHLAIALEPLDRGSRPRIEQTIRGELAVTVLRKRALNGHQLLRRGQQIGDWIPARRLRRHLDRRPHHHPQQAVARLSGRRQSVALFECADRRIGLGAIATVDGSVEISTQRQFALHRQDSFAARPRGRGGNIRRLRSRQGYSPGGLRDRQWPRREHRHRMWTGLQEQAVDRDDRDGGDADNRGEFNRTMQQHGQRALDQAHRQVRRLKSSFRPRHFSSPQCSTAEPGFCFQ